MRAKVRCLAVAGAVLASLFTAVPRGHAAAGPAGPPAFSGVPLVIAGVKSSCDVWVARTVVWMRCVPAVKSKKSKPAPPKA